MISIRFLISAILIATILIMSVGIGAANEVTLTLEGITADALPNNAMDVCVTGNHAYVADYTNGLVIVDISDPANPTTVGNFPSRIGNFGYTAAAIGVAVSGNYAYVANWYDDLYIIDITDKTNPTLANTYNIEDGADGITISGNLAFIAAAFAGVDIIDISDPVNPVFIGNYNTDDLAEDVAIQNNYAYIADRDDGVIIVDVSDLANPSFVGSCDTPYDANSIVVSGAYAYVADADDTLIIDISNPAAPAIVGQYDTGDAWGIALDGNYVYVGDGDNGVVVLNVNDPANPVYAGSYDTAGYAGGLNIVSNLVYVADGLLVILRTDASGTSGPVHNINKGTHYTTIQDAIDGASPGDEIHVDAGTYVENVIVDKQLALIGEGADMVIVQAADSQDHVIEVTADWVNLSGFTVTGTQYSWKAGIYLNHSNYSYISDNNASNNDCGILIGHSFNNNLQRNIYFDNWVGISLQSSSYNILKNNNASRSDYFGIHLEHSPSNTILNNLAFSNVYGGISVGESSSENNLTGNTANLNDGDGIYIWRSNNCILMNNNASSNGKIGIILEDANISTLSNNIVENNYGGIYLNDSIDNLIYHNNIKYNTNQANDDTAANSWDSGYPSGGNYWSDYIGNDDNKGLNQDQLGSDGIGDTPYPIPGGSSVDRYPLMVPWDAAPTTGPVHNINKGTDYTTIQAAIDDASPGDEIHVDSGTYYENVVVNKQLTLIGMNIGFGLPVVDAGGSSSAITLNADGIILEGFKTINSGNNWYSDAGIKVTSNNNRITANIATENVVGIRLYLSNDNILIDNDASYNSDPTTVNSFGIFLTSSNNNTLTGNTASNNIASGIYLTSSLNNSLYRNIVNNNYGGISFYQSNNNTINENIANNNSQNGMVISESMYNTLTSNIASNNSIRGIYLLGSNNNILIGNTANNNSIFGIALHLSSYNILSHNNLVDNINNNAFDTTENNQWDNGTEGNYYSDYTGTDSDGDGIGDTPYPILSGSSVDNYPLMNPWGSTPSAGLVHNINKGTDYTTIQAAIDDASPGDEIHVDSGTYYENVVVNKQLTLRGFDTGAGMPVIDAGGNGNVITLSTDGCLLDGFIITNSGLLEENAGIEITSNNNVIKNNEVFSNKWGIDLVSSNNNILKNNIVTFNSYPGIVLTSSNNNIISNNAANSNGYYGIELYLSSNNTVIDNIANSNTRYGIFVWKSDNDNKIISNTANDNDHAGIRFHTSNDNEVSGNILESNIKYSISMYGSNGNIISENNASFSENGIYLDSSSNNMIYHNNIIINTYQAFDNLGPNTWDNGYPSGGNYWSDYIEEDIKSGTNQDQPGSDGIGDTPYLIPGGSSVENYPLMAPYTPSEPTLPTITIISPNGGEDWQNGTTQTIQWSYAGDIGSNVQIELLKSGIVDHEIISSISIGSSGTGSYSWTIPSTQIPGIDYQIRVTSTTNSAFTDTSDGYFEISQTPIFSRETVEYINLTGTHFNLSLIDIKNNPDNSDYMVVVSPLLAQAFVAEDEKANQTEIQKTIDEKANQIEEALTAVLSVHPKAHIYFVDEDIGYQSNIEKLRADVYGLPFIYYRGPGLELSNMIDQDHGDIKTYKEIENAQIKPTNEIWIGYRNLINNKAKSTRNGNNFYILILGSDSEFPEFKSNGKIGLLDDVNFFSDLFYVNEDIISENNKIAQENINGKVGRLPIEYTSDYFYTDKVFHKKALVHSMYVARQFGIIPVLEFRDNFFNPILKDLTGQDLGKIKEPDNLLNGFKEGSGNIKEKTYNVSYFIAKESYTENLEIDLKEYSVLATGWHGNTNGIYSHPKKGINKKEFKLINVHPIVYTGTSCQASNVGYYDKNGIGKSEELFSSALLTNGSTITGNTLYGVDKSLLISSAFINHLQYSKDVGTAWEGIIKGYSGKPNFLYARNQFRLLGDPKLNTIALDDPLDNNASPLPQYFNININASYNETSIDDHYILNMNLSSSSSQNITYTLTDDQYSTGSGAPMVPVIYLDIPMPVNQTIDNVTVVFDNTYTQTISLAEYVSILLTPDGAEVIPGIEIHGDYPSVNFTYSLVTVPDERLLKITAIPVKYNIDSQIAELYRSINITVNTKSYVEENVTAKVHIDPSMDYIALHQSENISLILSLYNDYSATENATDVSVIAEIPDDLEVIDTDGTQIGHNITWEFDNLTIAGVNSFRSVEMVIQAPVSILGFLTEKINVTATYSNESGGFYEPTESSIQVSLIPPDYVDLKVSNMVIQKPLKLGTPTNVSTIISNEGEIGLKYVPVTLLIDGNESSGGIINLPANENINLNLSINGLEPGSHQISVIVQPVGLETNLTNNIATEEVDIYFAMLPPLSPIITYNLSNGSTLPIKFIVKDNDTDEFIYDDSVNISIFNSSNSIIANFNVSSGIQIDLDNKEYAVGFDTKDYSQLTLGEIYTVSVSFGSQLYATTDFTIIVDLTSPSNITHLNSTEGESWINWTWTNPPDPDFNHTEVYLNATFITNIPAPQNYYNASGLLPDTSYELSTRTVDTSGNINETWVNATARTFSVSDDIPPTITFISPTNPSGTTLTTRNWTSINVSLSEPGLSWLEWNDINESMAGSGTNWYINKTDLVNGVYSYRVWANDTAENENVSETRTIEVDYITDDFSPIITITSPINDTLYTTDSFDLNYTINEPTEWEGYSLDGADNITLSGNTTLFGLNDGEHILTVYANDTSGNMNSSTVWFTIDTTPPEGISDLQHTAGQIWINWTWTNPPDPDFNHTEIYLNGIFQTNTSAEFFNATDLTPGTEYTISTRTVDINGNINLTWVNDTATTIDLYNITFLPPITIIDQFNLTNGRTLPIKFTSQDNDTGDFIYDDTVNVTIKNSTGHLITYFTYGTGTDSVRINSTEEQYIVNFHTRNYALNVGETYAITVTFGEPDSLRGYEITYFTLVDKGKGKEK